MGAKLATFRDIANKNYVNESKKNKRSARVEDLADRD
jgi:hypothetical protein